MAKCLNLDWIWPHLEGDAEPHPHNRDYFSAKHAHLLNEMERILASLLALVKERVQSVESKFMALFTLTSVLSVLSVAVIAGLAASSTLSAGEKAARIISMLLVFYVVLQLLCLLLATVAGLARKSYMQLSPEDIVPQEGEDSDAYRVRLLNLQMECMRWNEWVVNQKVSKMEVAHLALKNALIAIFILIVLVGLNSLIILVLSSYGVVWGAWGNKLGPWWDVQDLIGPPCGGLTGLK